MAGEIITGKLPIESRVIDDCGIQSDAFMSFVDSQRGLMDALVSNTVRWLTEVNAPPVDYQLAAKCLLDDLGFYFDSAWMDALDIFQQGVDNGEKRNK
jgi:hypothetical protein